MSMLQRAAHCKYVKRVSEDSDSYEFAVSEHLRMSGVYWGACALHLLNALDTLDRDFIIGFVASCWHECGGFSGNIGHDPHILYTLSAVQVLILFDAEHELPRLAERVMSYVHSLQKEDGSFTGDEWGEVDTRFSYCALCCASLLGRFDMINVDAAVHYVRSCENFDGGFGCEPGGESHAGQVFTCVGALALAGALHHCREETLSWWLCERQTPGGGLNGRPQKDADVCYSWWVLSALTLLRHTDWIDSSALRSFILQCQDEDAGGISDKPGDEPDVFHTFFGVAGLALLGTDDVPAVDAAHALPVSVMLKLRARQEARAAAAAAARVRGGELEEKLAEERRAGWQGTGGEASVQSIPTVSLQAFLDDDEEGKAAAAREWDSACRNVGFLKVVDHGVPAAVISRCWEEAALFFERPMDEKRAAPMSEAYPYGYQAMGVEKLKASLDEDDEAPGDAKELFNICLGVEGDAEVPTPRWPPESDAMRAAWTSYYHEMARLASRLYRMCALALALPEHWFEAHIDRHRNVVRAINYPEQARPPAPGQVRASTHTDYGALTILRLGGAYPGGLQVMGRNGAWVDVTTAAEDAFVINLGDLMARWTNDRWLSTPHRVVNPPESDAAKARRQSIAYFCNINMDAVVECIPTCRDESGAAKYEPMTAGEHLMRKHQQTVAGKLCYNHSDQPESQ